MQKLNLTFIQDNEFHNGNVTHTQSYKDDEVYDKEIVSVSLWYHTLLCVILTSLGINGVLLNTLVIRHFWIRKTSQTPYNIILINLSTVELLLAVSGISTDIICLLQNGWKLGENICVISGVLITTSGLVSILTLCLLSVVGYGYILRFPKKMDGDLSFCTISKLILFIWIYALTLSLPPAFGWGRYVPELSGIGCAPDWHTVDRSKTYIAWILVFGFFIPTNIIVISSLLTVRETNNPRVTLVYDHHQSRVIMPRKVNIQLITAMNMTYLMCWTPYAVVAFIKCFVSDTMIGAMESILPTIIVKVSICANPLLYIAFNPKLSKPFEVNEYSAEKEEKHSPDICLPSLKMILNEIQTKHIIFDMPSNDIL